MNKKTVETNKTSRRSFAKSAITTLALTPIVSLTTRAHDAQQDDPNLRQSSPITVGGGGSVGIDFNQQSFSAKRGTNGFSRDQDTLHKLWLIDMYGALENITPKNEDCIVNIQCKKGSKVSTITITGKPLGIAFDPGEFKKDIPPDGKKSIHHNTGYKIVKIDVHDKVTLETTSREAPTKGKCTIVVVNSL